MKIFFSNGRSLKIICGPLKGYKYIVKSDTGFSSLLGRWEKESQLVYLNSIFKGDIIFDLGANFGIHSMLYSKLVGSNGVVFSFEPLPSNIIDLGKHININLISNIKIVPLAISDKTGIIDFKLANHGGQGSLVGIGCETGETITVNSDTLDNYCSKRGIIPDFVKIDIEGAEGLALAGFEKTVTSCYPFFAIDLHNPDCDLQVGKFLQKHNYEAFRVINGFAKKKGSYSKLLQKVTYLTEPYPNPNGIWGVIWAVHPSRIEKVSDFINANLCNF